MARILEIHLIHSFPTSNMNSDDKGDPKEGTLGGVPRARIASAPIKNVARVSMAGMAHLAGTAPGPDNWLCSGDVVASMRTVRLPAHIERELGLLRRDPLEAKRVGVAMMQIAGIKMGEGGRTAQILMLSPRAAAALVGLAQRHFDAVLKAGLGVAAEEAETKEAREAGDPEAGVPEGEDPPAQKAGQRAPKAKGKLPAGLKEEILAAIAGRSDEARSTPLDQAMFGRFLANDPLAQVDAAFAVAHYIGVSRLYREDDFFTAHDTEARPPEARAALLSYTALTAPTFYGYISINVDALIANLHGDRGLAGRALRAFLAAMSTIVPTGKQNSTAPYTRPEFFMLTVRDTLPFSLVNAFTTPVEPPRAGEPGDLTDRAIAALDAHARGMARMYGPGSLGHTFAATAREVPLATLRLVDGPKIGEGGTAEAVAEKAAVAGAMERGLVTAAIEGAMARVGL